MAAHLQSEENLSIDLKGKLRQYLPVLFEFLDVEDFKPEQWNKLEANFMERHLQRKIAYESNGNYLLVASNFFDLITGKLRGERAYIIFFDLIRKLLEELAMRFTDSEKKLIVKTIYDLLISYDERFRNYLGELLVLNAMTKGADFVLLEVESSIVDQQTADFLFERNRDSGRELIEVVNIHIDENNTRLEERLTNQYARKLQKKTKGASNYNSFLLVPVIWAPYVDLKRILQLYQSGIIAHNPAVLEPVSYLAMTMADGSVTYKFGTLSTLLAGQV